MASPGGYVFTPGLYRVPDLLTEEQFVDYMKNTYGVEVAFLHSGEKPDHVVTRALGKDDDVTANAPDPVLQTFNERNFNFESTVEESPVEKETKSTKSSK